MQAVLASRAIGVDHLTPAQVFTTPHRLIPAGNRMITSAALHYLDWLVDYIVNDPDGEPRTTQQVIELIGSEGQDRGWDLTADLINNHAPDRDSEVTIIRKAVADAVDDLMASPSEGVVVTGLTPIKDGVIGLFNYHTLQEFEGQLSYALHHCTVDGFRPRIEGDISWPVTVGVVGLALPSDQWLLDGILISEAVQDTTSRGTTIKYCLCFNGVALNPYWDGRIVAIPGHGEGWWFNSSLYLPAGSYRLRPTIPLHGRYSGGPGVTTSSTMRFYSSDPRFLQGIITMDRALKVTSPSYQELELIRDVGWIPAIIQR